MYQACIKRVSSVYQACTKRVSSVCLGASSVSSVSSVCHSVPRHGTNDGRAGHPAAVFTGSATGAEAQLLSALALVSLGNFTFTLKCR